ncbi:class 1 fructose-bisphosphatase [Ilyomonas limi]|uniref:Fructose-1,6-bisphosphatase class 1 n=1 Tax=Ilyomonas limi TaxID=2575867 RepID=A0A4U3KTL5_9BACT|nr:class 1 fructose-bisphosphatase [Ilyomonas limi]TKK64844.1 class 1 fructose-bisphosphatase [Ilyomonas limi]
MYKKVLTLDEFTIQQLRLFPHATGELSALLRDIGLAAKRIYAEVSRAGIADILGATGDTNIQGEEVQQLDLFANNQLIAVLRHGMSCAGIASEEMEDMVAFDDAVNNNSKYVVMFDPLDGSSNIDINIPTGTIFGIYRRISSPGAPCILTDFLQPGYRQVAAGYVIYGPSAMLVYATRRGVNGFTLDPAIGEFCLSHPNMVCPENGSTYSINQGYFFQYTSAVQQYLAFCQQGAKKSVGYSQRYVGSMVADVHRTLLKGGIFLYPATAAKPKGKLRLMYECNPLAFILTVAGGKATNGAASILHLLPASLHEVTPVYMGSANMVSALQGFFSASGEICRQEVLIS